jgi:hypothetical protein
MNRRNFLTALGLGTAGLLLDPERLLWVPGQKTIFLPPVERFSIVTPEWVMREVMMRLKNNLVFATNIHRSYDAEFRAAGYAIPIGGRTPFSLAR